MMFILKPEGANREVIGVTLIENKNDYDFYFSDTEIATSKNFVIQEYLDVKK